ncbi:hypothetical protein ACWKWZ_28035, partial [Metapseudomonas otitidis]
MGVLYLFVWGVVVFVFVFYRWGFWLGGGVVGVMVSFFLVVVFLVCLLLLALGVAVLLMAPCGLEFLGAP